MDRYKNATFMKIQLNLNFSEFILSSFAYLRYNRILSFPIAVLMSKCTLPLVFCAILGKHNYGQEVGIS